MLTVLREPGPGRPPEVPARGRPWSVRVAGARSACPALELYAAGVLIDVVSATRVAPQLLRGARAVTLGRGQHALAWGRRPPPGADVVVEFSRGGRHAEPATVVHVAPWCWLAVADGRFTSVDVQAGPRRARRRLARGRSCH
jgi:hypothetical protein